MPKFRILDVTDTEIAVIDADDENEALADFVQTLVVVGDNEDEDEEDEDTSADLDERHVEERIAELYADRDSHIEEAWARENEGRVFSSPEGY